MVFLEAMTSRNRVPNKTPGHLNCGRAHIKSSVTKIELNYKLNSGNSAQSQVVNAYIFISL